jgi:hypothetical protein
LKNFAEVAKHFCEVRFGVAHFLAHGPSRRSPEAGPAIKTSLSLQEADRISGARSEQELLLYFRHGLYFRQRWREQAAQHVAI